MGVGAGVGMGGRWLGTQLCHFTQLPLDAVHVSVVEVREDHRLGVDNDHHDDSLAVHAPQEFLPKACTTGHGHAAAAPRELQGKGQEHVCGHGEGMRHRLVQDMLLVICTHPVPSVKGC